MKQLVLFRHAKSSWKYPVEDIHRPLAGRGLRQGRRMAQNCTLELPDKILCSAAVRAYSTCLMYMQANSIDLNRLHLCHEVYDLCARDLINFLQQVDNEVNVLWLFGHNPALNELASLLLGSELPNIVTSGFVSLDLAIDNWQLLNAGCAVLDELNLR